MKTKSFFALIAAAVAFAACKPTEPAFYPEGSLSATTLEIPNSGATETVTFTANASWTATSDADWIALNPESKTISDKTETTTNVLVNVGANPVYENRTGHVSFTVEGVAEKYVLTVTQIAGVPDRKLQALASTVDFSDASAKNATVKVVSTVSFTATSSAAWLKVSPANVTVENFTETVTDITLSAEANAGAAREATVTLAGQDVDPVVVKVTQAAYKEDIKIDITVTDITSSSATIKFTCSNPNVYFLPSCESTWFEGYSDNLADLAQADLDYWESKYGESYANYGFSSYHDLFFTGLCVQDEYEDTFELEANTTYHAYAFVVNDDYTVGSDVFYVDFTTEDLNYQFYGTAVWHDTFVSTVFNMEGMDLDMECDVYTDPSTPGVFYFDSPYNYANIAPWFDSTPEEMKQYTGNWKRTWLSIDVSDPAEVVVPFQELGCNMNSQYGWISGGFAGGYTVDSYGVYDAANGTITCDADGSRKVLWAMSKYSEGATKASTLAEDFVVTITKGGSPIYPGSVAPASVRKEKTAFNALPLYKKVNFVELR